MAGISVIAIFWLIYWMVKHPSTTAIIICIVLIIVITIAISGLSVLFSSI